MKIKLKDTEFDELVTMTLQEVIDDINRDRSDSWTDYDESDWVEGLSEFTYYEIEEIIWNPDEYTQYLDIVEQIKELKEANP